MSEERTKVFRKGDVIIKEGEFGNEAYELVDGKVEVSCTNSDEEDIVIAVLRPPHIFGEMALIEEKPRSATIKALEPVVVKVTSKEDFRNAMGNDPKATMPILRFMFERLRTQNRAFLTLAKNAAINTDEVLLSPVSQNRKSHLKLLADNEEAEKSLGKKSLRIKEFPYRIGRKTHKDDVFSFNDLLLNDSEPHQISPNHLLITYSDHSYWISDRGSKYGAMVNGKRIGLTNRKEVVRLKNGKNELRFGDIYSRYKFCLLVNYDKEGEEKSS